MKFLVCACIVLTPRVQQSTGATHFGAFLLPPKPLLAHN